MKKGGGGLKEIPAEAAARLFLRRQHLDRPFQQPLTEKSLARFVEDAGGLQLDSINVVERAHYLTLWSRFGPYDKTEVDRLVYQRRALFEYWAHAACWVSASDMPGWKRAMEDYAVHHTGWSSFLKAHASVLRKVEEDIRRRGPMTAGDFTRKKGKGKASGWWEWKPAQHALHYLWMRGRLAIHSRAHFQKSYDLGSRILPSVKPIEKGTFTEWHLRKTLHALGAASEADLSRYLTFPRIAPAERRRGLAAMLKSGEAVEIKVEHRAGRWFALAEDVPVLESVGPARGTTLLSPFDSFLWHRGRVKDLFGFDYKIEVYVPAPKRVHGYYSLPILHNGRLIGRLDPKNHREQKRLEIRSIHFSGKPDADAVAGTAEALRSFGAFLGAETISVPPGPLREIIPS